MRAHTKNYFEYFRIDYDSSTGYHDYIDCEVCKRQSDDIHHIERRVKGVKRLDAVENCIALCRDCHIKAHSGILTKEDLKEIHINKLGQ